MRLYFIVLILSIPFGVNANTESDTLRLQRDQCEALFLKNNLQLLAERLSIDQAEALRMQAKLWPNPTIAIEEVNPGNARRQTGGQEVIPPLGPLRANQQFAVSFEQLILTAGKRKKLVALEDVNVNMTRQFFQDLLRNLKLEFRHELTNLQYLQVERSIYDRQRQSVRQLVAAYQSQVSQGNVTRGEYIRLRALELEIAKSINEVNQRISEAQKQLKTLMHLPPASILEVTSGGFDFDEAAIRRLTVATLLDSARQSRPDLKVAQYQLESVQRRLSYERSLRVPDMTFMGAYDRYGNAFPNFFGLGIGIGLPVFNRNQGNIRVAKIGTDKSTLMLRHTERVIDNEVVLAFENLTYAIQFFDQIEPGYETTLDQLLSSYTRSFSSRNISMLEYLDFMEAYLENKKIIMDSRKDLIEKVEELNYVTGLEF